MLETLHRFIDIIAILLFVLSGTWGIIVFLAERRYPKSELWFHDQFNGTKRVFLWPRYFFYSLLAGAWLLASYSPDQEDDPKSPNLEEGP